MVAKTFPEPMVITLENGHTGELCRNGTFFVLTGQRLSRWSSHLTTFVLPGHVVQDRSVVNKGIQFAVQGSRKRTFITGGREGGRGVTGWRRTRVRGDDVTQRWRDEIIAKEGGKSRILMWG